jgi:hypothetical protein
VKPEFIKVKYRLAEQVARPGGMTVEMAMSRAGRELGMQAEAGHKSLGETIGRLETLCKEKTDSADTVYGYSAVILDVAGLFDRRTLCEAAYSLCELTDRLRTQNRQDWASISVHVNAMRLIWGTPESEIAAMKSVVEGLWVLTDRQKDPGLATEA